MHKSLIGHIQNNIWKNSSLADLPVAALKDGPAHWEQRKSRRPRYDQSHSQIHVNVPRSHEVIICCDIGMGVQQSQCLQNFHPYRLHTHNLIKLIKSVLGGHGKLRSPFKYECSYKHGNFFSYNQSKKSKSVGLKCLL